MLAYNYTLDPFQLTFKPIQRQFGTVREEIDATVRLISQSTSRPLAVALSGGIDSEVICRSLVAQNIKFDVFVMRYEDNLNAEDIEWSFKFCTKHNITPIVFDVDIVRFMCNGAVPYIDRGYQSHEIFRYLQIWLLEQAEIQGYGLIMGGREEPINRWQDQPAMLYTSGHLIPHQWNQDTGNNHWPSFFETTPELMAAYFDHPILKILSQDANYFVPNCFGISLEKIMILQQAFPELERRRKMTGFEHLYALKIKLQKRLVEQMPNVGSGCIPIAQIRHQLGLDNLSKTTTKNLTSAD